MIATKKNAPSTAATVQSAKIIKLQAKNITTPAKRQESGKIIPFQMHQDGVKWFYEELSKSTFGQAFIKAIISMGSSAQESKV